MHEEDMLFGIAQDIRESLETPKKELSDIVVPAFAVGIRFLDFDTFYKVRNGEINLRAADSSVRFKQFKDWFYANLDQYSEELDAVPEVQALLDPRTGYIIKDIEAIDTRVGTWTTGSSHRARWGGGNAIGRLHTLSEKDFDIFGNYDDERVGEYFIRTSEGREVMLGKGDLRVNVPKVGDHVIAIALSGDNFFTLQLLRPDPTTDYELRGVYCKPHEGRPEKPFTIGAYHMGQDVSPIKVVLKRHTD